MIILSFNCVRRRFFHEISADSSVRKLVFDATVEDREELTITNEGVLKHGELTVVEGTNSTFVGNISYVHAQENSLTGEKYPRAFSIYAWLPRDSFRTLLEANLEISLIHLLFYSSDDRGGMTYGSALDGSDINWDVSKENPVKAGSITFDIVPREGKDRKSKESNNFNAYTTQVPTSVVVKTDELTKQIKQLFWAVIIFGGIIVLKLLL